MCWEIYSNEMDLLFYLEAKIFDSHAELMWENMFISFMMEIYNA